MLIAVIPTLNRYDLLPGAIRALSSGTVCPDEIHVIDNGGVCPDMRSVRVTRPGCNLGVAASWNLGIRDAHARNAIPIVLNDDIAVAADAVANMLAHISNGAPLVCCNEGPPGVGQCWAMFSQTQEVTRRVGWYDEGFWPAYYEDCDYAQRLKRANIPVLLASDVFIAYTDGGAGATGRALGTHETRLFALAKERNRQRYVRKWGGMPGYETVALPFNSIIAVG